MTRTYEALKKAEAEKEKGLKTPLENIPVDGHEAPEIRWDMGGSPQIECQKIRVWLTNPASRGQRIQTVGRSALTTAQILLSSLASQKESLTKQTRKIRAALDSMLENKVDMARLSRAVDHH